MSLHGTRIYEGLGFDPPRTTASCPPCVRCGKPSYTDVYMVGYSFGGRVALCRVHAGHLAREMRKWVQTQPCPPQPQNTAGPGEAMYYYKWIAVDGDGVVVDGNG